MTISSFQFKRGSTLVFELALVDDDGAPVIIDVADMRAEVRDGSELLCVLTIATTAVPGTYLLSTDEDTSDWDYGVVMTDIRAEVGSNIVYSDTVAFSVVPQVTRVAEEPEVPAP